MSKYSEKKLRQSVSGETPVWAETLPPESGDDVGVEAVPAPAPAKSAKAKAPDYRDIAALCSYVSELLDEAAEIAAKAALRAEEAEAGCGRLQKCEIVSVRCSARATARHLKELARRVRGLKQK